jgi:acetolactate synthase regulatory subunit
MATCAPRKEQLSNDGSHRMKYNLDVIMTDAEGALERLLGRLRQRGFSMCSMNAGSVSDHASVRARITIEGTRPIEPLVNQLSKLFDVKYVAVSSPAEATLRYVYSQPDAQEQLALCASL